MRPLMIAAMLLALPAPAFAQAKPVASAEFCTDGALATVRINKVTDMATFKDAVTANAAWYAARDRKDRVVYVPVIVKDKDKNLTGISTAEAMTVHYYPGNVKSEIEMNDEWKAFVAKYKASSELVSETVACLPK
jgi:hypothetical protein